MYSKYDYQKKLNYDSYENPFSRILTELKTRLPDSNYQKELLLRGSFNNEVAAGMSQGLTLIDPEKDKQLFRQIDYEPLEQDKVNFDDVNYKINNRDKFDEGKQYINGLVDGVNENLKINNNLNNIFDGLKNNILEVGGVILLLLILFKKN